MFSLHEELFDEIEYKGKVYKLDLAFDNVLKLQKMLRDKNISPNNKVIIAIKMLFLEVPDIPIEELVELWRKVFEIAFEDDMKKEKRDLKGNIMPDADAKEPVLCLEQDAKHIYTSFMKDYGIDLFEQQGKLHWYKFKALLYDLSKDTKMQQIIEIRTSELPKGKNNQKQRQKMIEAKNHYKLKKGDD